MPSCWHALLAVALFGSFIVCTHGMSVPLLGSCGKFTCDTASSSSDAWQTCWFDQHLSHTNLALAAGDHTWKQRVLVNVTYMAADLGCLNVFFGGEAPVTGFAANSGSVFHLSQRLGCATLFVEHRGYGVSMPDIGDTSHRDGGAQPLSLLSSFEAIADVVHLVSCLKSGLSGAHVLPHAATLQSPVVAVGGSYGGMIATFARLKFPNVFDMALAASAPILLFEGAQMDAPGGEFAFAQSVTNAYTLANATCSKIIADGMARLRQLSGTVDGCAVLSQVFNTCGPLRVDQGQQIVFYAAYALITLAEVNYPYPVAFMTPQPLPAWPVSVACDAVLRHYEGAEPALHALAAATRVFAAAASPDDCVSLQPYAGLTLGSMRFNLDQPTWTWQSCTELSLRIGFGGPEHGDMFVPAPKNWSAVDTACQRTYGVRPLPSYWPRFYGGSRLLHGLSLAKNIIWSNGDLDPWRAGGVLRNVTPTAVAIPIAHAAHHLDLRGPHPQDPESVTVAREKEAMLLSQWMQDIRDSA